MGKSRKLTNLEQVALVMQQTKDRKEARRQASIKRKAESKQAAKDKKVTETEESSTFSIDILAEQRKIAQMYLDVSAICRSLLDEALLNPKDISASMLNVVMRLLNQSQNSLDQMVMLEVKEVEEQEREENDGMTDEEYQMVKEFEEREREYNLTEPMNLTKPKRRNK